MIGVKLSKPQRKLLAKLNELPSGSGLIAVARPSRDQVSLRSASVLESVGLATITVEYPDGDYMSRYIVRPKPGNDGSDAP